MADLHFIPNTTKDYPCVHCGGPGNVIREAQTLQETRLKCLRCNGLYSAEDSVNAKEAGVIPDGPQELQDQTPSGRDHKEGPERSEKQDQPGSQIRVPKSPAYVFISKDRERSEFVSKRDLRKAVLRWEYEGVNFDVFELIPKTVSATIDLR